MELLFGELRRVAASIKLKRQELSQLNDQWKALHVKISPELADPNLDQ